MKSQTVRIIDVLLFGPMMIKISAKMTGLDKQFLLIGGLLTIIYNGGNYLDSRK